MARTRMSDVNPICGSGLTIERSQRRLLAVNALSLGRAKCTAIVGPNGAGKSLLVRTLCGLQAPDQGTVTWAGRAPDVQRRRQVGLLLQRPVLLQRSAIKNIVYALRTGGVSDTSAHEIAQRAIDNAGLSALTHVPAHRLSGGEQQRLALARALALKPDMLFLDEATANVDPVSTLAIEQHLRQAIKVGLVVILVSHDMGQVKRLADEIVLMHMGEIVEQSAKQYFFEQSTNKITRRWLAGELLV